MSGVWWAILGRGPVWRAVRRAAPLGRAAGSIARSAARHAGTTRRPSAVRAGGGGSIERPARPRPPAPLTWRPPAGTHLQAAPPLCRDPRINPTPSLTPCLSGHQTGAWHRPTDRPTGSLARYKLGDARPKSSAFITLPPQINHTAACAIASSCIIMH